MVHRQLCFKDLARLFVSFIHGMASAIVNQCLPICRLHTKPTIGESEMNEFFETWKGIGYILKRSERWCRYMARRAEDPLPVFKVGGIVRLNASDLQGWLERQRQAAMPAPTPTGLTSNLQLIA